MNIIYAVGLGGTYRMEDWRRLDSRLGLLAF